MRFGFSGWTCHPCFHSQSFYERWSLGLMVGGWDSNKPGSISHQEAIDMKSSKFFHKSYVTCFPFSPLFFQYQFHPFLLSTQIASLFFQPFAIFAAFWVGDGDVSWLFQVKFIKRGRNILTAWPPDVASQMAMWNLFLGRWSSNEWFLVRFRGVGWALWMFGSPFNLVEKLDIGRVGKKSNLFGKQIG